MYYKRVDFLCTLGAQKQVSTYINRAHGGRKSQKNKDVFL